jgi:hypothetical protein
MSWQGQKQCALLSGDSLPRFAGKRKPSSKNIDREARGPHLPVIAQQPCQRPCDQGIFDCAYPHRKITACAASLLRSSSNRDKPSGPGTTASPSIVKLLALICPPAAAIAAGRTIQSYACDRKAVPRGHPGDRLSGNRYSESTGRDNCTSRSPTRLDGRLDAWLEDQLGRCSADQRRASELSRPHLFKRNATAWRAWRSARAFGRYSSTMRRN